MCSHENRTFCYISKTPCTSSIIFKLAVVLLWALLFLFLGRVETVCAFKISSWTILRVQYLLFISDFRSLLIYSILITNELLFFSYIREVIDEYTKFIVESNFNVTSNRWIFSHEYFPISLQLSKRHWNKKTSIQKSKKNCCSCRGTRRNKWSKSPSRCRLLLWKCHRLSLLIRVTLPRLRLERDLRALPKMTIVIGWWKRRKEVDRIGIMNILRKLSQNHSKCTFF